MTTMTNAKGSFILLVAAAIFFWMGMLLTEVDSPKRWGVVIVSLLGVPASFLWGLVSLVKEKDKSSRTLSTITLVISGAILLAGVYKIFW
tara:strand:+ start:1574 stop:1843 length:270 start_codon:yes stop_codon:yes gene_type:complete